MELKTILLGGIVLLAMILYVISLCKVGKDQPLDTNARDRYNNSRF